MGDYTNIIERQLDRCLIETNLDIGQKYVGKVRDTYDCGDKMVIITTDRQSAFDRVLAAVPFKGQVLNQCSAYWFDATKHIVPNHVIDTPEPNMTLAKKCEVLPIEFVVRGYITGTTSTSLWTQYEKGVREYCGLSFPDGLQKNQRLDGPVITPTTKEVEHDRPIAPADIVSEGWLTQEEWDYASEKALALFAFGTELARERGLILVDTKYEFGRDAEGNIVLIDEIHTPDSSRYWFSEGYEERFEKGLEPDNIDKEFLRLWFKDNCDPYNDDVLPEAPKELITELASRYIQLYEVITGKAFAFPDVTEY